MTQIFVKYILHLCIFRHLKLEIALAIPASNDEEKWNPYTSISGSWCAPRPGSQRVNDVTLMHDHTNQPNYYPGGLYNNRGDLMVCDPNNNNIHRYKHDGQTIKLADDVIPWWVTRHGDGDQYVVSDHNNDQVVLIDDKGEVTTHYKGDIQGVKVDGLHDVTTDPYRGVLMANSWQNQVLLLRRTGDVVKILDQHVISPRTLYLDTDHNRLYVSGKDQHSVYHVFIFEYITLQKCVKKLIMKIDKLDLKVEL